MILTTEYAGPRNAMVDSQILARGIHDPRVLNAMRAVPRHLFVPPNQRDHAYDDRPLHIGSGQTISQPYMVAIMTELLHLDGTEHVLEVGTGSGYQAAILSMLAKSVVTLERHLSLADAARNRLSRLGYDNVTVKCVDGSEGYREFAPYDAIVVTAAAPHTPGALVEQLADGGRLVCPIGSEYVQRLTVLHRTGDTIDTMHSIDCVFVPLVGESGWTDEQAARWRRGL